MTSFPTLNELLGKEPVANYLSLRTFLSISLKS